MEARLLRLAILAASLCGLGAQHRTPNFVVDAPTARMAEQIGKAAENYRRDLAIYWLGEELPRNWKNPCPITAKVADGLGAGGATSFLFDRGEVYGWRMEIQGPLDRVLDSVLPHEVTHTLFASFFRQPLPRWADEGACTTVEHGSERAKQKQMLVAFLRTGRGIPFSRMFMMKDYPADIMPLYSQGYSLVSFLIYRGGPGKFLSFVGDGLKDEQWIDAVREHYEFANLAALQDAWLDWVRIGSPAPKGAQPGADSVASAALAGNDRRSRPEPNLLYRGQSADGAEADGALVQVKPSPSPSDVATGRGSKAERSGGIFGLGILPLRPRRNEPSAIDSSAGKPVVEDVIQEDAGDAGAGEIESPEPKMRPRQTLLEWKRGEAASEEPAAELAEESESREGRAPAVELDASTKSPAAYFLR